MILSFSKKIIFLILILFFLILNKNNNLSAADKIIIKKKINNEIITNIDIKKESNYLKALNKNLTNLRNEEIYEIAEESLEREKVKYIEIKKFIDVENFDQPEVLDNVISEIMNNLELDNMQEFENYIKNFNITIKDIRKKITIEILWNQLIATKYKSKIVIDESKILKRIKSENLNNKEIIEYDLSEIIFQAKNQSQFNSIVEEIKVNIKNIGFKNTAIKFSISDTAKFGGSVGKIKENQLSKLIYDELKKINIGEYTLPLNLGSNFIILFVNDKKIINQTIDEELILNNIIEFEKKKQYENFSQIYFNKIKIDTEINEF